MARLRRLRFGPLALCAILAGCAQLGGSPAPSAATAASAQRSVNPAAYIVWVFNGKGNTDASWHSHGDSNDCHGTVKAWAATANFYVNARTGKLYTKSAIPPTISVTLSLEGQCTNGDSGPTFAAEDYKFKFGEVKRPDPPSPFSTADVTGYTDDPDITGSVTLSGQVCNAKILTSTYREGDAKTYLEIDPLELKPVRSRIGCD